jgi:phage terminase small subunit
MTTNQPLALTDPALLEELSPRERAFVQHPLVATDPVQAAREVGYAEGTAIHAGDRARKLLYYIQHYTKQRMAVVGVTQQKIIEELAAIAFADETDYFEAVDTASGDTVKQVKDLKRLPPAMRKAIKSLNYGYVTQDGVVLPHAVQFELHDKVQALKALAEYFGLRQGKAGGSAEQDPIERRMLEQFTTEELETLNALYETAANRTKKAVSRRKDADAIDAPK